MNRDDDTPEKTLERSRRFDANPPGNNSRQEPSFSNFEDLHEDGYEEPDRDTNFASGYRADSVADEEEYDDTSAEEDARESLSDDHSDSEYESDQALAEDSDDDWLEREIELEDEDDGGQGWPLGLIVVAIVALVLLAAGGYGVLQQRAATQEELRELRAALAVAASPEDVGASRGALETLQQSYDKLSADAQALTLENRRLADTVAGLESQLGVQQSVPTSTVAVQGKPDTSAPASRNADASNSAETNSSRVTTPREAAPQTAAPPQAMPEQSTPEPAPKPSAAPVPANPSGPWFVNFGTYATRNMADTWASRLRPIAGEVIIAPNDKDGRTLYRVRVVGLADRNSAQQVARKLETDLRVPELWVGRE